MKQQKKDLSAADILEQAADLIFTVGHVKHSLADWNNTTGAVIGYCALGAMNQVAWGDPEEFWAATEVANPPPMARTRLLAAARLRDHLEKATGEAFVLVPVWNDDEERTADEVIEAMRATAKDLRNEA